MKHITINLENLKNNIRTNNQISTATHDLALYLMLKYNLFRSADNKVYSFRDNTLKYVDLRELINEELAPVQTNTYLVNKVRSYFTYIGDLNNIRAYYNIENNINTDNQVAKNRHKAVAGVITEEIQRLEKLRSKVTID